MSHHRLLKISVFYKFIFFLTFLGAPGLQPVVLAQGTSQDGPQEQPFSSLNVRMSNQAVVPPANLVWKTISLNGLTVARPFEGPAPRAAIIEDDDRQRIALLSEDSSGSLQLYLLEPVPLDPQLPGLIQCADARQCRADRMPLTGGLACLAICLKELLEAVALTPP